LPIQLTVSGAFDGSAGLWNESATGTIDGFAFSDSGTPTWYDPSGNADDSSDDTYTSDLNGHKYHVVNTKSVSNDPIIIGQLISHTVTTIEDLSDPKHPPPRVVNETDFETMLNDIKISFGYTDSGAWNFGGSGLVNVDTGLGTSSVMMVPEPATWVMVLAGFAGIGGTIRLKKHLRQREASAPHERARHGPRQLHTARLD
jgi:hypothetical protein